MAGPKLQPLRERARRSRLLRRLLGRADDPRELYLDLLERAVTHTLYFPPDVRYPAENLRRPFEDAIKEEGIPLEGLNDVQRREEGRDWPQYAQTMVGMKRIHNLRKCVETVLADRVPGDLIEAGVWRGGSAIMMRGILKAHNVADRTVWCADSFQGLPEPNREKYPADAQDMGHTAVELKITVDEVRNNFARYGLYDPQVKFVEGWFRDTLPGLRDRRWSVVRLDGDLYESTMDGLKNLYPQLSPGGFLIVDDYGWPNCAQAVEDYRREHGITEPIERIDWVGAFWRKRA